MLRVLPFSVQVLGFQLQGFMPTFHCAHCSVNFISLSQRVSELQDYSPSTDFEPTLHPSLAQYFGLPFRVTWSLSLAVTIPINKNHLNFQSFLTSLYKMPASQGHHKDWMNYICKNTLWSNCKAQYNSLTRLWLLGVALEGTLILFQKYAHCCRFSMVSYSLQRAFMYS